MIQIDEEHKNYVRIEKAIKFLNEHQLSQPSLGELSNYIGISEFHLQRLFSEWAGVSPKQFLQFLTKEHAKQQLKNNSVMGAALSSGLSGSSRLHDLMISCEGVTPGEYKSWGKGVAISYGLHRSPFGYCFIAITEKGICKLSFHSRVSEKKAVLAELGADWPNAKISQDEVATAQVLMKIFGENKKAKSLHLLLKGSPFQLKVWEALLTIPAGQLSSYQQVAESVGKGSAVRAVASAVARNNVALLIPCHRVIRSTGVLSNYRWGAERKAAMIGWEISQTLK